MTTTPTERTGASLHGNAPADTPGAGPEHPWLTERLTRVSAAPHEVTRAVAEAARAMPGEGAEAVHRARTALVVAALAGDGHGNAGGNEHGTEHGNERGTADGTTPEVALIADLYDRGSTDERCAVIGALATMTAQAAQRGEDLTEPIRALTVRLLQDALRTNDPLLVATAMTGAATRHLDQHSWRHGVLKLIFMGRPVGGVHGLADRRDEELGVMARRFAAERRAADRSVPDDLSLLGADELD